MFIRLKDSPRDTLHAPELLDDAQFVFAAEVVADVVIMYLIFSSISTSQLHASYMTLRPIRADSQQIITSIHLLSYMPVTWSLCPIRDIVVPVHSLLAFLLYEFRLQGVFYDSRSHGIILVLYAKSCPQ